MLDKRDIEPEAEEILPRAKTRRPPIESSHLAPAVRALEERARTVRLHILNMIHRAGSGHAGPSLSIADILVALYFARLRHDPKQPAWRDRDRLILSKGHAAPALYATLAEAGYFPVEDLLNLRRMESPLQGHPELGTPGVDVMSGSLGQGLSIANGIAMAGRLDGKTYRVYVLLGDGECDEGQVWEAAMTASHYKLENVVVIVDCNNMQSDGSTEQIKSKKPLAEKWKAFGWRVFEINGHDFYDILLTLDEALEVKGRPKAIIAHTVKGKGVSFMENNGDFHSGALSEQIFERASIELGHPVKSSGSERSR